MSNQVVHLQVSRIQLIALQSSLPLALPCASGSGSASFQQQEPSQLTERSIAHAHASEQAHSALRLQTYQIPVAEASSFNHDKTPAWRLGVFVVGFQRGSTNSGSNACTRSWQHSSTRTLTLAQQSNLWILPPNMSGCWPTAAVPTSGRSSLRHGYDSVGSQRLSPLQSLIPPSAPPPSWRRALTRPGQVQRSSVKGRPRPTEQATHCEVLLKMLSKVLSKVHPAWP